MMMTTGADAETPPSPARGSTPTSPMNMSMAAGEVGVRSSSVTSPHRRIGGIAGSPSSAISG